MNCRKLFRLFEAVKCLRTKRRGSTASKMVLYASTTQGKGQAVAKDSGSSPLNKAESYVGGAAGSKDRIGLSVRWPPEVEFDCIYQRERGGDPSCFEPQAFSLIIWLEIGPIDVQGTYVGARREQQLKLGNKGPK